MCLSSLLRLDFGREYQQFRYQISLTSGQASRERYHHPLHMLPHDATSCEACS